MRYAVLLLIVTLSILSCSRVWNNPFETDSDLSHAPLITNIQMDSNNRLLLYLDYSYGSDCTVLFERKSETAFEPVTLFKVSASVFADTTLNMEQNYNLVYRLRVKKNGYTSDYSPEKQFSYISNVLNAPTGLTCSSIELQGVRLNWTDNSSKETGFRIEKNVNGSGFAEAADLAANTTTWLDAISGMPDPPQSIIYRIRAYNNNLNSAWTEQNVIYSGLGAPTNLSIVDNTAGHFIISWTNHSVVATAYDIERKKDSTGFVVITSVNGSVSSYTDNIIESGDYYYRVRARKGNMYSSYSNTVHSYVHIPALSWNTDEALPSSTNPNGQWSFGRKWSPTNSTFDLLTVHGDEGGWWMGNWSHGAPNIRPGIVVWAKDNSNGIPAVRWTCPANGEYSLSAVFTGADSRGVDVVVYVVVNNSVFYSGDIHADLASVVYDNPALALSQGDIIDLIVQWDGGVYSEYNWTKINATISN